MSMGSSSERRIFTVPSDSVNSRFSVRSSRRPVRRALATMMTAMASTAASARPVLEKMRRLVIASARLARVDHDDGRVQPEGNQDRVVDEIAQVDDSLLDGIEMREEAEGRDGVHQRLRRPALEEVEDQREAAQDEQEADHHADHEGDDLAPGQRRDARADGQEPAGHEQAADVARDDHRVVGIAEVVDGDPDGEGERQRDGAEAPRGQELPEHGIRDGHRQRHEQLDGAGLAFLGPQSHGHGRDQEQVQPGVEAEEGFEVRLPTLVERPQVEREDPGEEQEDDDEDVRYRRREVAVQLALQDRKDVVHATAPSRLTDVVSRRNASSMSPEGERARSSAGVPSNSSCPAAMMMARVHTASTSSRMCVEMTMALSAAICRMSVRTSCFWLGSRPSVGSSMMSTPGSWRIACATPTRRL